MEIDFTKYTAREILSALVEGLRNPEYKVNMDTYGCNPFKFDNCDGYVVLRDKNGKAIHENICVACAATNAITKLTGVKYNIDNISNRIKAFNNKTTSTDLIYFESALDSLRKGNLNEYNIYDIKTISNPRNIELPFLNNNYTEEQLLIYESLIDDQIIEDNKIPCNKCKTLISKEEFEYGMGECLTCFPG